MWSPLLAVWLAASAPAEVRIDVGRVDLSRLPALEQSGPSLPTENMVTRAEEILASPDCRIPGQRADSFDIDVPFAVLVEPGGQARRVVVSELGCPDLETFTGLVVLELAKQGYLKPSSAAKAQWFGSTLNFNLR